LRKRSARNRQRDKKRGNAGRNGVMPDSERSRSWRAASLLHFVFHNLRPILAAGIALDPGISRCRGNMTL
jgi:hypothetical protein